MREHYLLRFETMAGLLGSIAIANDAQAQSGDTGLAQQLTNPLASRPGGRTR